MPQTALAGFLLASLLLGQDEGPGKIRLVFQGEISERGDITVFAAETPLEEGVLLDADIRGALRSGAAMGVQGGAAGNRRAAKEGMEVEQKEEKNAVELTMPAGTYHVRIKVYEDCRIWLTDLKVAGGKTLEQRVLLEGPGSVKGMYMVSQELHPGRRRSMPYRAVALLRSGKLWASSAEQKEESEEEFRIPKAPPGTYTMLILDEKEELVSITDDVRIVAGRETSTNVNVNRSSLGGFRIQFVNKRTGSEIKTEDVKKAVVWDERKRFALVPEVTYRSDPGGKNVFGPLTTLSMPASCKYSVYASIPECEPAEKKGVPALPAAGKDAEGSFVYPVLKVQVTPKE